MAKKTHRLLKAGMLAGAGAAAVMFTKKYMQVQEEQKSDSDAEEKTEFSPETVNKGQAYFV